MVSSVSSSGQSILTALGAGGGLDASALATNLTNAEKVPQQNLIDKQKAAYTSTVSSVGKVKSSLGTLQSALSALGDVKSFQTMASSGDTSRVTVAFKPGISPPTFSNYVQVQQVASATTVSFPPLSSIDTSVLGTNATPRTLRLVSGTVQNSVVAGSGMLLPAVATSDLVTINGVDIPLTVDPQKSLSENRKATIDAINANSSQTGVSAVDSGDDTKGITMTSGDGRSIHTSFAAGVGTIKFPDMRPGTSVNVAGLTFNATQDVLGSDVADAFANLANGADSSSATSNFGNFTGTLTGWSSNTVLVNGGDELTFTSASPANLPDLSIGTSDATQPITKTADTPWLTSAMTGLSAGTYGADNGGPATMPGKPMGNALSSGSGSIVINGMTVNVTMGIDATTNRNSIVAAINAQTKTTGVTAVNNGSNDQGISLTAAIGKAISVSIPQLINSSSINALDVTNSGLSEGVVNPPYALSGTSSMTLPSVEKTGTVTINGIDVPITVGTTSNEDNRNAIVDAINAAIDDAVNNGNADLVGITATNAGDSKGITFASADGRAIKMGLSSGLTAADTGLKPNVLLSMDLSASDTLVTVRDKINTISGMTATIVQGGTSSDPLYYLSVKSATGEINNFYADVTAVGGTTPLDGTDTSNLDPVADGLLGNYYSSLTIGQDAKISIDGVSISSSTNVFDKAIPGMTITAVGVTDANTPVTIKSETNTTALTAAINSLVTGYNQVISTMTAEMAYNSTDNTKSGGLANNATARTLVEQLRSFTTQQIQGYDNNVYTLADIGVKTNRDGTLTLDQAAFDAALTTKPDMVAAVMASKQSISDSRLSPGKIDSTAKAGVYTIKKETLSPQITTVAGTASAYEAATVAFNDLAAGGYVTVGGLTFTATSAMAASNVAAAFANLSTGATTGPSTGLGTYSGTLTGWSTGSSNANKLTFLASTFGDVTDLTSAGTSLGWTINGEPATLSGMTLTAGATSKATGISVLIPTDLSAAAADGFSATLNYSKGILERFNAMIADATGTSSSLQSLSNTDTKNLSDLDQKQNDLDARMETIRLRYLDQFTRVQTLLTQAKSTQSSLTDFQTAWSNSLKGN
jgi:flagellar hook-associated protein 2